MSSHACLSRSKTARTSEPSRPVRERDYGKTTLPTRSRSLDVALQQLPLLVDDEYNPGPVTCLKCRRAATAEGLAFSETTYGREG